MTRSDLVESVGSRFQHLTKVDVDQALATILEALGGALEQGRRIEIRGFGSFSVTYRKPRLGRNPRSGSAVQVLGKSVPHFKPGKILRETLLKQE